MSKHSYIPKDVLETLYLDQHKTMEQIGEMFGKTRARICQLIKKYDIDTTNAESFMVKCPTCEVEFRTTRKRYTSVALRFCKPSCYLAYKSIVRK